MQAARVPLHPRKEGWQVVAGQKSQLVTKQVDPRAAVEEFGQTTSHTDVFRQVTIQINEGNGVERTGTF